MTNKRKQYGHQHNRQTLWRSILALPEVDAVVYNPGKQKNTTFNRNLIANIIYITKVSQVKIHKRDLT